MVSLGTCENKIITIPKGIRYESPALQPGERQQTINIQPLEEKPKSKARQDVLIEDLTDVEADKNQEILA